MHNSLFILSARWQGAAGLNLLQSLSAARPFFHAGFHSGGTHKRFGILIPGGKKLSDRFLQVTDAEEGTATNPLPRRRLPSSSGNAASP
ncbi:MAG: hypothetical protein DMG39_02230 [Acidobacteria bacterium]|nr:MAG: hypothetical protein DMG39_02230 [Acidobacteriota bacterium]